MDDKPVVLCDPLCFVVNKFGHTDAKTLNSALFDFFSSEVLCAAKMRLVDDVVKINLEYILPHILRRRDGDGRLQKEVDDLMMIFTCLDEHKAIDKLPKYVSESPDNMPSLRLYEGDMNAIMKLLNIMASKISEIGSALAAITHDVRTLQRVAPPEQSSAAHVSVSDTDTEEEFPA